MIIWGSKGITGTTAQGNFNCPVCSSSQPYEQKRVRRFFTLYFIPIFPTSTLGEYVECRRCQGTFEPGILSYDPALESRRAEALYMTAVKSIMIHICLADGTIDPDEVLQIQAIYEQLTGTQISETDLIEEIQATSQSNSNLFDLLDHIVGQLNDHAKETAVLSAYLIAGADGNVDDSEMALITQIGTRLGLSAAHLTGILTTAQQQSPAAIA